MVAMLLTTHMLSLMLKPIWKADKYACNNTEDLLAAIRYLNKLNVCDDVVVGSLDVRALHPSLDI